MGANCKAKTTLVHPGKAPCTVHAYTSARRRAMLTCTCTLWCEVGRRPHLSSLSPLTGTSTQWHRSSLTALHLLCQLYSADSAPPPSPPSCTLPPPLLCWSLHARSPPVLPPHLILLPPPAHVHLLRPQPLRRARAGQSRVLARAAARLLQDQEGELYEVPAGLQRTSVRPAAHEANLRRARGADMSLHSAERDTVFCRHAATRTAAIQQGAGRCLGPVRAVAGV